MHARSLLLVAAGLVVGVLAGWFLAASQAWAAGEGVPVWLEVVQRVCTSVGGLGTFAALVFVVRQFTLLRDQSDLVQKNIRASLDGQLYARLDSFNKFVVEHAGEYERLGRPFGPDEPPDDRPRLHHLCGLGLSFYEEVYKYHVRYDLLETEDWEEWRQNLLYFVGKPYVRGYWEATRPRYAESFRRYLDGLLAGAGPAGSAAM
jgi:hypothetical protein